MMIKYPTGCDKYGEDTFDEDTVENYAVMQLLWKGTDKVYLENQPKEIAKCIGRLLEFLIKNNMMNKEAFCEILEEWHSKKVEIVRDE